MVEKSTVPVRTADAVRRVLACNEKNLEFQVFVAPIYSSFSPVSTYLLMLDDFGCIVILCEAAKPNHVMDCTKNGNRFCQTPSSWLRVQPCKTCCFPVVYSSVE